MENTQNNQKKSFFTEKIMNKQDFFGIIDTFFKMLFIGLILNLSLLVFGIKFNFWYILSLGCLHWFIDNEFITLIRRIFSKR